MAFLFPYNSECSGQLDLLSFKLSRNGMPNGLQNCTIRRCIKILIEAAIWEKYGELCDFFLFFFFLNCNGRFWLGFVIYFYYFRCFIVRCLLIWFRYISVSFFFFEKFETERSKMKMFSNWIIIIIEYPSTLYIGQKSEKKKKTWPDSANWLINLHFAFIPLRNTCWFCPFFFYYFLIKFAFLKMYFFCVHISPIWWLHLHPLHIAIPSIASHCALYSLHLIKNKK